MKYRPPAFCKQGIDNIKWEERESVHVDVDGKETRRTVKVPSTWSTLASDILAQKYLRGTEQGAMQLAVRVASKITGEAYEHGLMSDSTELADFESAIIYMMLNQVACFNSPVLFNCGIDVYDIPGGDVGFHWDYEEDAPVETTSYEHPQNSACFITSIEDDLGGIYDLVKTEAMLFKGGSGNGCNFSNLRESGAPLSGGGTSSGLMSFLEVFDAAAGATKSGGVSRRSAKMVCLDVAHPEILHFIDWKMKEERKAKALIAAGYDGGINGEAYRTVSGQNSNNSIRITDDFLVAVEHGGMLHTTSRVGGGVVASYPAREVWDRICRAAWECADPAVQFDGTINAWHTCPKAGRQRATNPCGEFAFIDNSACNLASINLVKFLNGNGTFDVDGFVDTVRTLVMAMDTIVSFSSYPTKKICENSYKYRPIGLGYSNLGGMLMSMGVPYDSQAGRDIAALITELMHTAAYLTSAELADRLGAFPGFHQNKLEMLMVVTKHVMAGVERDPVFDMPEVQEKLCVLRKELMQKTMFRNAQVTLLAPTGTIGLLMDCDTLGIEPAYSLIAYKKLVDGGTLKLVNQSVQPALEKLGYTPSEQAEILNHALSGSVVGSRYLKPEHYPVFDCAAECTQGRVIKPSGHLCMMATVQQFLSGAISKTVNLPASTTPEQIGEVYMSAYKLGLKGIAIYRDGSKAAQVLSTKQEPKHDTEPPRSTGRRRLPTRRRGITQEATVGGHKIYVRTGEYEDGSPGEIFLDMAKEGSTLRGLLDGLAVAVSLGLQHGVPLEAFMRQYEGTCFEPAGLVRGHKSIKLSSSLLDYIFRSLGIEYLDRKDLGNVKDEDYVAESSTTTSFDGKLCSSCGAVMHRNGSCFICRGCGSTSGCS